MKSIKPRVTKKSSKRVANQVAEARPNWLIALVVVLATGLAYLPILSNEFVEWDDSVNLVSNPHYRGLGWAQLRWMFTTFHMGHYQPLSWLTFAVDYLLWGLDPAGYHLTNLILHAANGALFYLMSWILLSRVFAGFAGENSWLLSLCSAASAFLFAIHPLRVESVAWATERRDVLSGFFYLLTLYTYLRAVAEDEAKTRRRWFVIAVVSYALSLLSKAAAITLPFVLLLLDVYPLQRLKGNLREWFRPDKRSLWAEKIPFFLLAGGFAITALSAQRSSGTLKTLAQYDAFSRIGQAAFGYLFYLWKTLIPIPLSPLYELPISTPTWNFMFFASAFASILITLSLFYLKNLWPALLASWIYYVIVLSPTSGIAQSGPQLVADRYSYFACMSWPLLIGGAIFGYCSRSSSSISRRLAPLVTIAAAISILGPLTRQQSLVWRNTRTLWQHVIAVAPKSSMAYYNLGKSFESENQLDEALRLYTSAVTLNPAYANAHHSLADLLARKDRQNEALEHYRLALQLKPDDAETHNNLGVLLEARGDTVAALEEFQKAAQVDRNFARAFFNLGRVFARQGELQKAADNYREAIRLDPNEAVLRISLAEVLARQGNLAAATDSLSSALGLKPDLADAHALLARLLAEQGKTDEAQKHYLEAVRLLKRERVGGTTTTGTP